MAAGARRRGARLHVDAASSTSPPHLLTHFRRSYLRGALACALNNGLGVPAMPAVPSCLRSAHSVTSRLSLLEPESFDDLTVRASKVGSRRQVVGVGKGSQLNGFFTSASCGCFVCHAGRFESADAWVVAASLTNENPAAAT